MNTTELPSGPVERIVGDQPTGAKMDICDELEARWGTVHSSAFNAMRKAKREIERLRAALTLAANRMDVLALDHDYGTTRRNIADDWARETRAALAPNTNSPTPSSD